MLFVPLLLLLCLKSLLKLCPKNVSKLATSPRGSRRFDTFLLVLEIIEYFSKSYLGMPQSISIIGTSYQYNFYFSLRNGKTTESIHPTVMVKATLAFWSFKASFLLALWLCLYARFLLRPLRIGFSEVSYNEERKFIYFQGCLGSYESLQYYYLSEKKEIIQIYHAF